MSVSVSTGLSSLVLGNGQYANSTITIFSEVTNYTFDATPRQPSYTGSNSVTVYAATITTQSGCTSGATTCRQFIQFNATGACYLDGTYTFTDFPLVCISGMTCDPTSSTKTFDVTLSNATTCTGGVGSYYSVMNNLWTVTAAPSKSAVRAGDTTNITLTFNPAVNVGQVLDSVVISEINSTVTNCQTNSIVTSYGSISPAYTAGSSTANLVMTMASPQVVCSPVRGTPNTMVLTVKINLNTSIPAPAGRRREAPGNNEYTLDIPFTVRAADDVEEEGAAGSAVAAQTEPLSQQNGANHATATPWAALAGLFMAALSTLF